MSHHVLSPGQFRMARLPHDVSAGGHASDVIDFAPPYSSMYSPKHAAGGEVDYTEDYPDVDYVEDN